MRCYHDQVRRKHKDRYADFDTGRSMQVYDNVSLTTGVYRQVGEGITLPEALTSVSLVGKGYDYDM